METAKMSARQWLGRARGINREIDALLKAKQETRDQMLRITQNYRSDGAQSTKDPHKYDRLVELENLIDQKVDELLTVKQEITDAIDNLSDGRQRTVLLDYYVRCISLEQTAYEMHYSYANVKKLRARAIDRLSDQRCGCPESLSPIIHQDAL